MTWGSRRILRDLADTGTVEVKLVHPYHTYLCACCLKTHERNGMNVAQQPPRTENATTTQEQTATICAMRAVYPPCSSAASRIIRVSSRTSQLSPATLLFVRNRRSQGWISGRAPPASATHKPTLSAPSHEGGGWGCEEALASRWNRVMFLSSFWVETVSCWFAVRAAWLVRSQSRPGTHAFNLVKHPNTPFSDSLSKHCDDVGVGLIGLWQA